jgi:hypothetical protein
VTRPRRSWGKIRKTTSGRYQASYMHNLVRHLAPMTFRAKMDAEGWLANERRLIEHRRPRPIIKPRLPRRRLSTTTRISEFGICA